MKKIKLNTVKSKMVAGVAAVTLFSGVGFVAANTDAGGALQGWYNKAFGTASTEMAVDTAKHGAKGIADFTLYSASETKDAVTSIVNTKNDEKKDKTEKIHAAKQNHINSVNEKEAEIAGYMDDQFDQLSKFSIEAFNITGNKTYNFAEFSLTLAANATGASALKTLEKELNTEKAKAVGELDTRILEAKAALLEQLKGEKEGTTKEIKDAIDAKIAQLKLDITAKKDALVKTHQDKLVAKANDIEAAAKAELDAQIMISINKN